MITKLLQLIVACTILLQMPPLASAAVEPLDQVVAVVNEDVILQSELEERIQIVKEQLAARNTRLPSDEIMRSQVLERLIVENLQRQVAIVRGIRISDSQLNAALGNIAAQNKMTLDQFRDALIAEGRDYQAVREQIKNEMLIRNVQQNVVNRRIRVSDQEVKNFLASETGQENTAAQYLLSHILISIPARAAPEMIKAAKAKALKIYQELQDGASFNELAIAQSDAQNALQGGDLGWRAASELPAELGDAIRALEPGQISKPIRAPSGFHLFQVRDKKGGAVQLVEQTKVRHILLKPSEIRTEQQTEREIQNLYRRVLQGESFATLAKDYSDDPGSGSEGGSLGWTQNGQMVPEFEQVMNNTPVKGVSEPFESRFGWHILEVEERRTVDMGEEMQENQARSIIAKRKFDEELTNWLRELRSQAYIDIKE
ncbi:peptidylprolyl isomerase [Neptuniibacter sp. CAU 1671]|uniref:peptidylprolyl isomerase n=1 Tax=Neptuniibacter sp. CAU 1671 TaxID=3032593 RepID=UPI0023DC9145|nr:peptidylprolyl isomerase [Neptuniibacter sp. CAU 1671]MDF2181435.1 peptidylprolyl isomerase [Neptuniibacter sp. CAU 1671]